MTATRGMTAEGVPPAAIVGGTFPVAYDPNRPWPQLAAYFGAEGFRLVDGCPAPSDYYQPAAAAQAVAETVPPETAEQHVQPARKTAYRLGSVAVESAGVIRADSLPGEEQTRERYQQFLAGIAMYASVERVAGTGAPEVSRRSSLNLLHEAARGNKESEAALLLDNQMHVAEVLGGVGERMEVELELDADGWTVWAGQNTVDRQFYTLTTYSDSPSMRAVRHAEGITGWRLRDRNRDGQLADKVVFDLSAVANASRDELQRAGCFLNSISVCIRATRFAGNKCTIASVFAAGVDQRKFKPQPKETEAQEAERQTAALGARFDIRVLRKIHALFGTPGAETMEPDELLAAQLVAPGNFDEVDFMMLYDQVATEEMEEGVQTFFGSVELWEQLGSPETVTREHYDAHIRDGARRQAENQALCQAITREQVRRAFEAATPLEAVELKRRVVLDIIVDRATEDRTIDETRLGRVAAGHINESRDRYDRGDKAGGDKYKNLAKEKAVDPSCPPGERNKKSDYGKENRNKEHDCTEVKDGDSVHCPYCNQDVIARVPKRGGRIYCSNKRCSAAYQKESIAEKAINRSKSGGAKPSFSVPANNPPGKRSQPAKPARQKQADRT